RESEGQIEPQRDAGPGTIGAADHRGRGLVMGHLARSRTAATLVLALSLTSCLVGPDYKRPDTGPPAQFRFASSAALDQASIADLEWFELFKDEALRELIQTALVQNYDLEIAAARVLQAQAQVGIVRSQIFPTITGAGSGQTTRLAQNRS